MIIFDLLQTLLVKFLFLRLELITTIRDSFNTYALVKKNCA